MSESSFERWRRQMELMQFETLPLFSKPYFSWNLKTDYVGRRFVYRPSAESTMDDARRMLERFRLSQGAILLAETQTAGRGRDGRAWYSPPDVNLYFTLVMQPTASLASEIAYLTPVAVARAIEEAASLHGVELRVDLKWPNDALLGGRKVAGTLIETTEAGDGELVALIGVGVNVNLDVAAHPEIAGVATSVREAAGRPLPREQLLALFCNHFEDVYEAARAGSRGPFEEWRARLITLGREVTASGGGRAVHGIAVDVSPSGSLLIQTAAGERVQVEAGDVTLGGLPQPATG